MNIERTLGNKPILLIAIRSEYLNWIIDGLKEFEIRKYRPKLDPPFMVAFYDTEIKALRGLARTDKVICGDVYDIERILKNSFMFKENSNRYPFLVGRTCVFHICDPIQIIPPIDLKTMKQLDPNITVQPTFTYIRKNSEMAKKLHLFYRSDLEKPIEEVGIRPLSEKNEKRFEDCAYGYVHREYGEIDYSFSRRIKRVSKLEIDPEGYFTKKKEIFEILADQKLAGFIVATEKYGGSVKLGPAIVFPEFRRKGLISIVHTILEYLLVKKECHKLYVTFPSYRTDLKSLFIKGGFHIEAQMREHYIPSQDEIVMAKKLKMENNQKYLAEINRPDISITRVCILKDFDEEFTRLMKKVFPNLYFDIDNKWISILINTCRSDEIDYSTKSKLILGGYTKDDELVGILITVPKRGGSVKMTPVINSRNPSVIYFLTKSAEKHYEDLERRKIYFIVADCDGPTIVGLKSLNYYAEGLLSRPWSTVTDAIVLSKMLNRK
jgi:predicted transcriptional regulator